MILKLFTCTWGYSSPTSWSLLVSFRCIDMKMWLLYPLSEFFLEYPILYFREHKVGFISQQFENTSPCAALDELLEILT